MAANEIGDLRQSVDRLASDMRDRFEQVDQRFERLEAQIRAQSAETREYADLAAHETRRHFDVVAQDLRCRSARVRRRFGRAIEEAGARA